MGIYPAANSQWNGDKDQNKIYKSLVADVHLWKIARNGLKDRKEWLADRTNRYEMAKDNINKKRLVGKGATIAIFTPGSMLATIENDFSA